MINLHDGRITDLLNNSLRYNPETIAKGYAVQKEKQRIMALAAQTRLMSAIGSLTERTLDYLAVELRTPVYRQYFSLEVKRKLIAATIPYYAHLGTPAAVDLVINAIFTGGHVQEWFEYEGGKPHHFRVFVNITGRVTQLAETEEMRLWVGETKRLSSWLDEIRYVMEAKDPAIFRMGGGVGAIVTLPVPVQDDEYDFRQTVRMGGGVGTIASIPVPQAQDVYKLRGATLRTGGGLGFGATLPVPQAQDVYNLRAATLRTGGGAGLTATVPVPEQQDSFRFERETRTGGTLGIAATLPVPEKPDAPELVSDIRVGGGRVGVAAIIPVPERSEPAEVRSEMRTGGACSIIATTPVVETKEE